MRRAVDDAVHAVGRQDDRLVLRRHPALIAPAAGGEDDQWPVAEVGESCRFVFGRSGLEELAAEFRVPYVCMHMRGNPQTMQGMTEYEDLVSEVLDFFICRRQACLRAGVMDIILDPGFGFAKTISQNFLLLRHLHVFSMLELPLMVGLSRKATVYKTLDIPPEQALNGTTVLHTLALEQGAKILRVHDVREAVEAVKLWTAYRKS